jgi:site-specific DNA-adenine methylase
LTSHGSFHAYGIDHPKQKQVGQFYFGTVGQISIGTDTLFYLDPPYWQTCGYGVEFGLDQYTQMAHLARSIQGNMIISVNDIPEMRDVFKGLHIDTVSLKYSLGDNKKQANELIIRNF